MNGKFSIYSSIDGSNNAVTGWGRRPSGLRAVKQAAEKGQPFLLLEDGFLRSLGREDKALSIVYDNLGIYYDAAVPSLLEQLVVRSLAEGETNRTNAIIKAWRDGRLSKYNYAREYVGPLPERYVLVIDQTHNDTSIQYGLADATSFSTMLQAALAENPECSVIVKTHPDRYSRGKKGYFHPSTLPHDKRLHFIDEECHPVRLIENAEAVYVVTSQIGFEALIWGKKVHCFGMPFYAGWGLTVDRLDAPNRRQSVPLEQLVHAALVEYPRYVSPRMDAPCEVEIIMEHLALQRCMRNRFSKQLYAYGFTRWKRPILRRFAQGSDVSFVKHINNIPADADLLVWGRCKQADFVKENRIVRVEDGFLRSAGLGVDLVTPLSWVFDDVGIYYDASSPSKLEEILNERAFSPKLLVQAESLMAKLIATGITKYNLSAPIWRRPVTDKKVILVPGQVEDDASIQFGAGDIRTTLDLLKAVRSAEPDAYIVYKPHPDVVAGLRQGIKNDVETTSYCDEFIVNADVAQLLNAVDEVHCLTSLMGFEALLRQKPVTCYGAPFYAGWGLTKDQLEIKRRKKRLTLNELVVGCLMLYPAYFDHKADFFISADDALDELIEWCKRGQSGPSWQRRLLRIGLRLFKGVKRYHPLLRKNRNSSDERK